MNSEQFTEFTRKAINILFVANPTGTSIGVLLGVVFDGLLGLFSPFLKTVETLNVAAIKLWHLIGLGIISINIPVYFRRKEVDPSIQNAIDFIEKQRKNKKISDWQAKQMYADLLKKVLENVTLDNDRQLQADRVNALVSQPDGESESKK